MDEKILFDFCKIALYVKRESLIQIYYNVLFN